MSLNGKKGVKPVVDCTGDKGFTVQADRDDADINKIVARLEKGATLTRQSLKEPFYGDVSHLDGLQDALMKVQESKDLFMSYDANLRERFDNDPVQFVDFLLDEKNLDEAISLGLAKPKPVVIATPPVVPAL